jgi:hypothetical protein
LLSALHRQQSWRSAALLENKMQLAAREAADQGKEVTVAPPTEQAEAVLALRSAAASGAGGNEAFAGVLRVTPTVQFFALLDDIALSGSRKLIESESSRAGLEESIPHLDAPVPDAAK